MSASVATPTTPSSSSSSSAVAASSTTPVLTGSASTPGGMHRESNAAAATPGPTTVLSSSFNFGPIATPTSTAVTTPPVVGATTTPNQSQAQTTPLLQHMPEEKVYKKEKQIWLEFDATTKDLKSQLNDGVKCLEQRLDTQIAILFELQDFFKKRAEVEMQYSRDLDKLVKQVYTRHKSERTKRENWPLHSAYKLWESLLNDTKQHSKYHQIASDVCSKYVADRFDDIVDDIKRMFTKCKAVAQSAHEEIFKVVGELNGAMKTYHEYQSESKQAEAKLRYVQSQKPKYEKQKSKKKLKQYEKQVEKRLQKYTETKVKAFKARNEYILSIDSANACINKFCSEDIGDIVDCMDYGFHASVAKCIYMYLSAQENIKRSRQQTVDNISRSIGDLDSNADKKSYLDFYSFIFSINRKFAFEPHKGDEVSQVNAQSLIRYEMEKRFEQLDMRLKTLKTENDEIFKTIEATEHSLLNYFDVKNCDMTDLFRDLNIPVNGANTPAGAASKVKRIEIEDYYVEKVRQYSISSNLIARLEARHRMMQKALGGCVNSSELDKASSFDKSSPTITSASMHSNLLNMGSSFGGVGSGGSGGSERKKKIGKSPLIGQPRLFGGKLVEYLAATKQDLPQIMTSCVKAINRLGLHNQGIFRIPGSQLEINQFKEAFEKGDDPLVTVNPREMNSVAGVLKLYLRELKEPLFPRELYDQFIGALRVSLPAPPPPPQSASSDALLNGGPTNDLSSNSSTASPGENIEAAKIDSIRRTMALVPKPIYIVIRYLFAFLNHLSEYKDENMMDAYNIAICLAPTLIPVPEDKKDQVNHQTDTIELIKLIIQHNDEIFNIECDGPVYEKFDSEMDNDEENLDESEDDEEDESEKQYLRNISDDELYVAEAIALYDYKGRTDKELSFKKGTQLAIRGQLSTDWWQGSLIASNNGANTPLKVGYIPDKYIAFRSSSKKRHLNTSSSTAQTTVQSTTTSSPLQLLTNMSSSAAVINTTKSTPPANNMNQSLRSSHHHTIHHHPHHHPYPLPHHNHGSATRASLDILELSSVNQPPPTHQYRHQRGASTDPLLCSQPHVKESDILNDECDNTASNPSNSMNEIIAAAALAAAAAVDQTAANLNEELHLQRFQPNSSSMRSASVSLQHTLQHKASSNNYSAAANRMHSQSIKKRNSSSPSSSNSISFDTHFVNSVNQVANNTSNNTNTLTTRQYNSNNGNNYLNMSSSTTGTLSNRGVASRSSYTKSSSSNNTANRGVVTSPANRSGSGLDMELAYLLASTTSAAAAAVAAASQSINSNVPKQQMKVNHIEDALASVLDDMKKLDCSGNLSNEMADDISHKGTVSHQPPPLFSTRSTSSSSSASNTPSATTPHQRTRETRDSNANGSFTTTTPPPPPPVHSYSAFKFSSDSSSSSQDNPKYEEKPLSNDSKTAAPNSTESETKRPDLVIDLPIVMAANNNNTNSSSPSSSSTSGSSQAATVLPIKKPPMVSHRQSTPPSSQTVTYTTTVTVNTNPMIATASDGVGVSAAARNDDVVKSISMMENSATSSSSSQVRRLSVDGVLSSSSASSSLSSSPAANTANNKTQLVDVSDATLSSSIHQQDRIENGEMVMMSTKPLKSCSTSSTDSSVCSSSVSSSNVVNPNPKQQPTTTTSLTTSKEEDEIESISPPRIAVAQFVRSPQTTVASITQPTDSSSSTSSTTVAAKKKPPPLMKKPEKSEEILRKLGRSPPSIDTNNANTTAQTTLSSPPIASPPSSASSNSPAANLSLRLSNSKATDV